MTESKIPLLAVASILPFSSALALADETTHAKLRAEAKISEADARPSSSLRATRTFVAISSVFRSGAHWAA